MEKNKKLGNREKKELLKIISDYANSWILLRKYDRGQLKIGKTQKTKYQFNYQEAIQMIIELRDNLAKKEKDKDLLGIEREEGLKGILGNLNQIIGNKELYPSIEEKAAHLLYFIIKDHVFVDGNKRIGAFLFIVFLAKNKYLFNKKGEKKFSDNALVSLALLVAESRPEHKDLIIKLIVNFLKD